MKKEKLFDRIFKPELITLNNGHQVSRPKSRLPLICVCLVIVVAISLSLTEFDLSIVIERFHQLFVILGKIFNPNFSFLPKVIEPLIETIQMSLLGSIIGSTLALPLAILASSNINKNKVVVSTLRFMFGLIRTIPTLILASLFGLFFGLGAFAGTVAISLFTFGIVGKMLFESIETIDLKAYEALESLGCSKFSAFRTACIPQILPTYLSHSLYCFEINVRAAAILGYVGAGGLGIVINERVGFRDYESLGTVLFTLFIAVLIIDQLSTYLRRKLS